MSKPKPLFEKGTHVDIFIGRKRIGRLRLGMDARLKPVRIKGLGVLKFRSVQKV